MVLPEGLQFLKPGWWLIHAVTVWLVFLWGYRRGRGDERRAQRLREPRSGERTSHGGQ
jgi:hypothetical protein